ncbi:hypothetical protein [Paraburkholderia sp. 40]
MLKETLPVMRDHVLVVADAVQVAARGAAVPLGIAVVGRNRLTVRWNVR